MKKSHAHLHADCSSNIFDKRFLRETRVPNHRHIGIRKYKCL